jgi:hypothetical protein
MTSGIGIDAESRLWDDTDTLGLIVLVLVVAIIFAAALLSRRRSGRRDDTLSP